MKKISEMDNKFYSKGELKDKKILEVLKKLPEQYENGEIAEVRDIMEEIIFAIDEFESEYRIFMHTNEQIVIEV